MIGHALFIVLVIMSGSVHATVSQVNASTSSSVKYMDDGPCIYTGCVGGDEISCMDTTGCQARCTTSPWPYDYISFMYARINAGACHGFKCGVDRAVTPIPHTLPQAICPCPLPSSSFL